MPFAIQFLSGITTVEENLAIVILYMVSEAYILITSVHIKLDSNKSGMDPHFACCCQKAIIAIFCCATPHPCRVRCCQIYELPRLYSSTFSKKILCKRMHLHQKLTALTGLAVTKVPNKNVHSVKVIPMNRRRMKLVMKAELASLNVRTIM